MKNNAAYIIFLFVAILISVFIYKLYAIDNNFIAKDYYNLAHHAVDDKTLHPFIHITVDTTKEINGIELHFANSEYRLLLPLFANVLKFNSHQLIRLQFYLLPIFLFILLMFLYRETQQVLLPILLTATFIGSYLYLCFYQQFPFFDAYALLVMGFILVSKNKHILFVLLMMGFLLDERMLLSSALIVLLNTYLETKDITIKSVFAYLKNHKYFLYTWVIYFLVRIVLIVKCNFYTSPATYLFFSKSEITNNIRGGILSIIYTYKFWLAILFFNLYSTIKTEKYQLYITLFTITLLVIISYIFVYDFSRINLYFFPFILLNVFLFIYQIKNKSSYIYIVILIILINLALPSKLIYGGLRNKEQNIHTIWNK